VHLLAHGLTAEGQLIHVIAYSDPASERRDIPGLLDDYAFTAIACLDAYEATADLSYFNFARRVVDNMVDGFFDALGGGFFDTGKSAAEGQKALGVLGSRRKPFQDSPTPAGNSAAAIALLRLHAYTNQQSYRDQAEQTLRILVAIAGQYGLYAGTYGIAAVHFTEPHTQVVIIGNDELAGKLRAAATESFSLGKAVLQLTPDKAVAQNLPPALAETIPQLPLVKEGRTGAVICAGFTCRPPITDPERLTNELRGEGKNLVVVKKG
jgi:uncharacterized protein